MFPAERAPGQIDWNKFVADRLYGGCRDLQKAASALSLVPA
jgi:hypothetical protein